MTGERVQIGNAVASPTKAFFVRMLTRDIELQDAILDLLDNCVDGILRSAPPAPGEQRPYEGFWANIVMSPDYFTIEDNCGGIPIEVARKYAFALGRPPGAPTDDHPTTVGMYGIGMKRAIFKLGTDALVESRNDTGFAVEFSPEWMQEDEWNDLPMYELSDNKLEYNGTKILITELNDDVKSYFSNNNWVDEFRKTIARHYSIIISKGFSVRVSTLGEDVSESLSIEAEEFRLLRSDISEQDERVIAPYAYVGEIDGVKIEIYAGLYRELLSESEMEEEEETRGRAEDAGWTVACNDRVVIWKDKTKLTGWGEATVPNYHGQFIAITGIVLLSCPNPKKLPLTTTKRGIDASSKIYLDAKDFMRESTKQLTSFTNKWKKFPDKMKEMYRESRYMDLPSLREIPETVQMTNSRKVVGIRKFEPKYPEPVQEKTSARVTFVASKKDISLLGEHFFEDPRAKPGDVGEAAFNRALNDLRGGKK